MLFKGISVFLLLTIMIGLAFGEAWGPEVDKYERDLEKINKALQAGKLSYSTIVNQVRVCFDAHIQYFFYRSFLNTLIKLYTNKDTNFGRSYNDSIKGSSIKLDAFHNYNYCMSKIAT
ncbi:uncharacterized protein LOC109600037 isoform X1 [Aethina tumida]|uniref:uncharacterized protein LOC109600037 isoform X1 n=2 Tax=Aethina tumida TaxID=116153 RepID=UPI002147F6D5|nr:uncharacterized protein LOC109600037 isoform X1 [Aethina tumida]